MKGAAPVITNLQALLAAEYNCNLQFRNNRIALKFLGIGKLSKKFDKLADQSHDFYQLLTKRLMQLGGSTSVNVGAITEEGDVLSLLKNALSAEANLINLGLAGIKIAVDNGDEDTAEKLRHVEERHENRSTWIEQQISLIDQMGISIYLSEKL
jgi:bacterioferritin (cytochrome b1)